jgi:hypothetical protein
LSQIAEIDQALTRCQQRFLGFRIVLVEGGVAWLPALIMIESRI